MVMSVDKELELMEGNPSIAQKELAEPVGKSEHTIKTRMNTLQEKVYWKPEVDKDFLYYVFSMNAIKYANGRTTFIVFRYRR